MKFYVTKVLILIFITFAFFSCKKESTLNEKSLGYFTFKIGNSTYQIDSLQFGKVSNYSGLACVNFFNGKSKDGKYTITFECNNQDDSISLGKYIVSDLPLGIYHGKRVQNFNLNIRDDADPNNATFYQLATDFTMNITQLQGNYIEGTFSGKMTGGISSGGFSASAYYDIRTVELTQGKFGMKFFPF